MSKNSVKGNIVLNPSPGVKKRDIHVGPIGVPSNTLSNSARVGPIPTWKNINKLSAKVGPIMAPSNKCY